MDLTDDQKSAIAEWIRSGKSLADVQQLLREEFDLSLTYMDVRFLVDDLNITFAEPEAEEKAQDPDKGASAEEAEIVDEGGGVSVDVDAVVRPGSLVSGTVTFGDGVRMGWQLTASGQLGLIPGDNPDYRPSPEDVESFQTQLQEVLRKKGF